MASERRRGYDTPRTAAERDVAQAAQRLELAETRLRVLDGPKPPPTPPPPPRGVRGSVADEIPRPSVSGMRARTTATPTHSRASTLSEEVLWPRRTQSWDAESSWGDDTWRTRGSWDADAWQSRGWFHDVRADDAGDDESLADDAGGDEARADDAGGDEARADDAGDAASHESDKAYEDGEDCADDVAPAERASDTDGEDAAETEAMWNTYFAKHGSYPRNPYDAPSSNPYASSSTGDHGGGSPHKRRRSDTHRRGSEGSGSSAAGGGRRYSAAGGSGGGYGGHAGDEEFRRHDDRSRGGNGGGGGGGGKGGGKNSGRPSDRRRGGWLNRTNALVELVLADDKTSEAKHLAREMMVLLDQPLDATTPGGWRVKAKLLCELVCADRYEMAYEMARTFRWTADKEASVEEDASR